MDISFQLILHGVTTVYQQKCLLSVLHQVSRGDYPMMRGRAHGKPQLIEKLAGAPGITGTTSWPSLI